MLLSYKLRVTKKQINEITDKIVSILNGNIDSGTIRLKLTDKDIIAIRNYCLGDYLWQTYSFKSKFSDDSYLDSLVKVFSNENDLLSKTTFKNELFNLKKEFENHRELKLKEDKNYDETGVSSELISKYLDQLCHNQNNLSSNIESDGLVSNLKCRVLEDYSMDSDYTNGTLSDFIGRELGRMWMLYKY